MRASAVLRACFLVGLLSLTGCMEELNRNLSEAEANDITALLLDHGLAAARVREKDGSVTVTIQEGQFSQAVSLLKANGLPRQSHASVTDVFKGDGLVSSPTEERARYVYALDEQLAGTLAQIDGVLTARVHIVLPDSDPTRRDPIQSAASVFIRYAPGATVGEQVAQLKQLVSNAVPGLAYDKVSVVIIPAAITTPRAGAADLGALTSVAGIWVNSGSATTLQAILAVLVAAIAGLAVIVAWLIVKQRGRRTSLFALR